MTSLKEQSIGIMTTNAVEYTPFPEANFYAELAAESAKNDIRLYVFFPESIQLQQKKMEGFQYVNGQWVKAIFPFPQVVYDRVFYTSKYYHKNKDTVRKFKEVSDVIFMNRGLPSKWEIYQQLRKDARIRSHLPRQELFTTKERLNSLLTKEQSIIIKPIAGGFGKKVLHVITGTPTILEGRNANNQFFRKSFRTQKEAITFLAPKLNRRYLLQQYLELSTAEGNPFDIRIFSQKNANGHWSIIGKGVRLGPRHQLTSNIRGGGEAVSFQSFIRDMHPSKYEQISTIVDQIGHLVPQILEKAYSPLFELGIDVGVDRFGAVWIIEANAKPGRKIFDLMGDQQAAQQVIKGPINYARFLLERNQGGSV